MKNDLKSKVVTYGRKMTGARSLWRANGMKEEHFGRPIIAISNSFTQFVPGHAHLHNAGQIIKSVIEEQGCFAAEFNTIAIDDGIAMGHEGMLYSLPSREIIADSIEYMCNAHRADALVCISNCDKITPGMLMATMRLNIPTIFVSGGPMEAGKYKNRKIDLVDAIVMGADDNISENELLEIEKKSCPTCGSCSGMFTANSMNCLTEALGLAFPGNGTILATHHERLNLLKKAGKRIVELAGLYYEKGDSTVLPISIANRTAFLNAMTLDIAMGGSTNTILHLLAIANEAGVWFNLSDIDLLSRNTPCLCKVSPNSAYHMEDVNRAGGVMGILIELDKGGLIDRNTARIDYATLGLALDRYNIFHANASEEVINLYRSAAGKVMNHRMGMQSELNKELDTDRKVGCIRSIKYAYHHDGGLAVLYGNIATQGCVVKTAGINPEMFYFKGKAIVFSSQETAVDGILNGLVKEGHVVVIRYEGPRGGPGMQEMLYPTAYLKSRGLDQKCALITDGRFSGGTSGLSIGHISPEAASGGEIALVRIGDEIEIDIRNRMINLLINDVEMNRRKEAETMKGKDAYKPADRKRVISKSLQIYALNVSSADKGAIRELNH